MEGFRTRFSKEILFQRNYNPFSLHPFVESTSVHLEDDHDIKYGNGILINIQHHEWNATSVLKFNNIVILQKFPEWQLGV